MKKVNSVEEYILNKAQWKPVLEKLRNIILSTGLDETIKWAAPVYTFNGKNIVGIGAFKSYAGLWFFQGALLIDKMQLLINAQEGKTSALRQWRFKSVEEINVDLVKAYVFEAIQNQKLGKEIKPDRMKPLIIPDELQSILEKDQQMNVSFSKLTLSKQREYADYISEAKRDTTKQSRLEKIKSMIIAEQGLHDKYKNS